MLNQLEENAVNRGDTQDIDKYNDYVDRYFDLLGLDEAYGSREGDITKKNRLFGMAVSNLLCFCDLIFREEFKEEFIAYEYHKVIAHKLMGAYDGIVRRLLINIPPRFGKTNLAVIMFISWCMGRNPKSKFIHITYGHKLARQNCESIRKVMNSETYQKIFPDVKLDSSRQDYIQTVQGGYVHASGSEGTVTGFGCGHNVTQKGFGGALIIDDPHKSDEVYSNTKRNKVLNNYYQTLRSRVNDQVNTPIIIIGQRLHQEDLWGFLMKKDEGNKNPEGWDKVIFPIVKDGVFLENFNTDPKTIKLLEENSSYVYQSQYLQEPIPKGGLLFKEEWWKWFDPDHRPNMSRYIITGDTAQKTSEVHSFSVFQCWGVSTEGYIYLIDLIRGKWKAPDLRRNFINFYDSSLAKTGQTIIQVYIEDKSSGTGLIQDLQSQNQLDIIPVKRYTDKVSRSYDMIPYIEGGAVYLPKKAIWLSDYLNEFRLFSDLDKGDNLKDDQIDATLDAIDILLRKTKKSYYSMAGLI